MDLHKYFRFSSETSAQDREDHEVSNVHDSLEDSEVVESTEKIVSDEN